MTTDIVGVCQDIVRNLTVNLAYALSKCRKCKDCPYDVPKIIEGELAKAERRLIRARRYEKFQ